jgi:PPK2 family polyphosphate:nucleotide phosphotransferase
MSWASKLAKPYRIDHGKNFRLKDFDPAATSGIHSHSKDEAQKLLDQGIKELSELQDKLYAQDNWALLLMFQGMDAAGKDGAIKHVMSGVNPQGCQVYSFKQPSPEELNHDYLWRSSKVLPERGRIGIFNRSYYEEVLVTRVHSEILKNERIPASLIGKNIWEERYEDIRNLEHYLSHNGIVVRKFFLNISKKEQKRRFLERLETPAKNWKFSAADLTARQSWDEYMKAFEEMIAATSTKHSPWYVVPADNKWYTRLVVAAAVVDALKELKLAYPTVDAAQRKQLASAKKELLRKK